MPQNATKKLAAGIFIFMVSLVSLVFLSVHSADAANLTPSVAKEPSLSYSSVREFAEGIAPVCRQDKWGFVDGSGKEILPCKYDSVSSFCGGFGAFSKLTEIRDSAGRLITYTYKWGIADQTGKVIVQPKYDEVSMSEDSEAFSEGLAWVRLGKKYGFIDTTGREVVPCKYDAVQAFSGGRALVKLNRKYGFIDTTGKEVVSLKYDNACSFSDGFARVNIGYSETKVGNTINKIYGQWGLIDTTGKEIVHPQYGGISEFHEGLAAVNKGGSWPESIGGGGLSIIMYSGGLWGYIDTNGKQVIPLKYTDIKSFCHGLAPVKSGGKWGFIDSSDNMVISPKYDYTYGFYDDGLAIVESANKYGVIDLKGREVVPLKYEDVYCVSEGLACVRLNNKWGYVNLSGQQVIPSQYVYESWFQDGVSKVMIKGRLIYIDKSGKEVAPPQGYTWAGGYTEGLRPFINGQDLYGYMDTAGNVVVQPKYTWADNFYGGFAWVKQNGKYGILKIADLTASPIK